MRPTVDPRHYKAPIRLYVGENATKASRKSQAGQVYGSASGRNDVGPDLLEGFGVSLGGPHGKEGRDGKLRNCKW